MIEGPAGRGPVPASTHPVTAHRRIVFLKAVVDDPIIEVGDYTYYDDPDEPERFVERCVSHHYEFIGDRLIIGRFCALATGIRFVMNGANHATTGFSTYPFNIFGGGWEAGFDLDTVQAGWKGDTVVGHDVWIWEGATILPGISIGNGAIVAMGSMVTRDVLPYAVVAGNPARPVKMRFPLETVERLLAVGWRDWPADRISRNLGAIRGADLEALEAAR